MSPEITRFAPSPNGLLHLGHAFSAFVGAAAAKRSGGRFLLRIEDIDLGRARPEFEEAIFEDLAWLGLEWETPVRRQSAHFDDYRDALDRLTERGVTYPCFCTRKEIAAEVARSVTAPHGPEGALYPGICRGLSEDERTDRIAEGEAHAVRLDVSRAIDVVGEKLIWNDADDGDIEAAPETLGDVVLARKDIPTGYHLSVTVDDALQGITLVTRGRDLFHATHIHRILQALLGLPVPRYLHHQLIEDEAGNRLAKSAGSSALRALREAGESPEDIREMLSENIS